MTMRDLAIVVCSLFLSASLDAASIGKVVSLQGSASAKAVDANVRALQLKSPVFQGDTIHTKAGSKIQIMFEDDTVISQGEKSEMTIDEYVYSPKKKEDNKASLSMKRGRFRCITGKVTKLNPNRFKVKTRMATIGIRGCDVGFVITETAEDVYVIELHGKESVVVETKAGAEGLFDGLRGEKWDDPQRKKKLINVLKSGMIVSITQGKGMAQRELTPDEAATLIQSVTPDRVGDVPVPGGDVPAGDDPPPPGGDLPPRGDEPPPPGGDLQPLGDPTAVDNGVSGLPPVFDPNQPPPPPPAPAPPPVEDLQPPPPPPPVTGGDSGPVSTFIQKNTGSNWKWGIWEVDGMLDRVAFTGTEIRDRTGFNFKNDVINGAMLYTLNGAGDAAAVVRQGGAAMLLEGYNDTLRRPNPGDSGCALNVQVGLGVTPTWDGDIRVGNLRGDSLRFMAIGTIEDSGRLVGNPLTYQLQYGGSTFLIGDIDPDPGPPVTGRLVGAGGALPITGAIGSFRFGHGGGTTTVEGGFGSDLN